MQIAARKFNIGRTIRRSVVRLDNAVWWVRYRVQPGLSRHKIRSDLSPGWYDPDTQMLHAMMACLRDFVEGSGGVEKLESWSRDLRVQKHDQHGPEMAAEIHASHSAQADLQDEAVAIWRWWTEVEPKDRKAHERELMRCFGDHHTRESWDALPDAEREQIRKDRDAHHEREKELDAREDEMLARLLKIRRSLWT
jgi:hypothetical protein